MPLSNSCLRTAKLLSFWRRMSRTKAKEMFTWDAAQRFLRERGVTLLSAGLDEVPMAYKNIREVMAAQSDLVTVLGQFDPKLVKMAPHGERAGWLSVAQDCRTKGGGQPERHLEPDLAAAEIVAEQIAAGADSVGDGVRVDPQPASRRDPAAVFL